MRRAYGIDGVVRWCRTLVVVLSLALLTGVAVTAPPAQAAAAAEDFTLSLSAAELGVDPAVIRRTVPEIQAEISKAGSLSASLKQSMTDNPVTKSNYDDADWVDFKGSLAATSDGSSMTLTVPASEIQTSASWWTKFGAMVVGGLAGYGLRMVCIGGLTSSGVGAATIPLICTPLGGASAGFFASVITHAVDKDLNTATAWRDIVLATLAGMALGYLWEKYFVGFAKEYLPEAFKKLGTWLASKVPWIGSRFGTPLAEAAEETSGILIELEELLDEAMADWGSSAGSSQMVAIASYIHPGADPAAWNRLIGARSDKVSVMVANVLNGPDSKRNTAWADVINRGHASGKRVLGYVPTGYLGRTDIPTRLGSTSAADWIAQIEQDVDTWYELYGDAIGGIFFDEGYNVCGIDNDYANFYEEINRYAKTRHPGAMTVLNPGTVVPQCYEDTADVLMTYESDYAAYYGRNSNAALNYKPLDWTPADPSKIWHIIYDVPASEVARVAATSKERGAGYIQITDDVLPNPYDTLPSGAYWEAHQNAVTGGVPIIAPPAPYSDTPGPAIQPATNLTVTKVDYTSVSLSWTRSTTGIARYYIVLNGNTVASLPGRFHTTTIGGLNPGGNTYTLSVVAQNFYGTVAPTSNTVSAKTLTLTGGKTVTNAKVTRSGGNITYSADFLVPYSFHRVYVSPTVTPASCWLIATDSPANPFCGTWVIENSTLLSYAGATSGQWSWNPVAYVPPTINGYTYSWTVKASDAAGSSDYVSFQGEGYGPLTNVYTSK
ncbi:spherulation-specific family 4 protein [Streptomyces sp. NPDC093109]|uniref:spherulation-specific family 4 protein n=1 Tax=Streptomyces sp. NPDC093109 TaxID=3154977 RepID=UPI00344FC5DF